MSSSLTNFKAGDTLIRENELSRKMFVIKKGKVRVFKTYMGQKITLGTFGEGEVFGEMSFFDAQPRSASVEALTDGESYIIDGAQAEQQLAALPEWIVSVLKTVFHRFRELDNKLVVYQSMNEVERRHFGSDRVAQTIYHELMRFNRLAEMLFMRLTSGSKSTHEEKFLREYKDIIGGSKISMELYWRLLKKFDFVNEAQLNRTGDLVLDLKALERFQGYLSKEHQAGTYRFMTLPGLGLLRKIVNWVGHEGKNPKDKELINVPYNELKWSTAPYFQEAIQDLQSYSLILYYDNDMMQLRAEETYNIFLVQSMLRAFDNQSFVME